MTDKQVKDDVSNFCLVCYYDNRTNELVRVEHYEDNSGDMKSDIDSYKYGYNAEIIKPEEIIKQLKRSEAQCEAMFVSHTDLEKKYKVKEQECEELKAKIEYVFSDASPNFDYFCDICVAKDSCNQNCCFEQIKELIYEVK